MHSENTYPELYSRLTTHPIALVSEVVEDDVLRQQQRANPHVRHWIKLSSVPLGAMYLMTCRAARTALREERKLRNGRL